MEGYFKGVLLVPSKIRKSKTKEGIFNRIRLIDGSIFNCWSLSAKAAISLLTSGDFTTKMNLTNSGNSIKKNQFLLDKSILFGGALRRRYSVDQYRKNLRDPIDQITTNNNLFRN